MQQRSLPPYTRPLTRKSKPLRFLSAVWRNGVPVLLTSAPVQQFYEFATQMVAQIALVVPQDFFAVLLLKSALAIGFGFIILALL